MTEFVDDRNSEPNTPHPDSSYDVDDAHHSTQLDLIGVVTEKETRKLEARRAKNGSVWFGLGMFGMIGWSVAVPAVMCVALGIWIDNNWPSRFSWTLMLLLLGMALGCLNAWFWVTRERSQIGRQHDPKEVEE